MTIKRLDLTDHYATRVLVTGGTGLLGSHLVEKLAARGDRVRVLARDSSDTSFVESHGAEVVRGNLGNPEDCRRALQDVTVVYHAAAKVGDWGTWPEFQRDCLDATSNLVAASARAGVRRFLHISSTSAYGHPREGGPPVDESVPLGQHLWPVWDDYTRSKVEQERLLWEIARRDDLPLTVIRPSWLYGERDRTTSRRLVARLKRGQVLLIGRGNNPLSAIYAGEVADAAILAANDPQAIGEAFNITDLGPITQREFINLWAEACGLPQVTRWLSYNLTFAAALGFEAVGRWTRNPNPPLITRYATWLMGRDVRYSTAKAREKLGWKPRFDYRESIARTVRWLQS